MTKVKGFLSKIGEIPDAIRAWRGGAKAAERIEPAAEGAAKTAAKTEAAAGKAVEKMSDATKRAIADVNEHLSSLTPGRVGKEHLDDRLKALGESAKQHDLVDASVRTGRDQLSAKAALEKLKNGEKVTPKEFSDVQASITNDFIKYENVAQKRSVEAALAAQGKSGSGSAIGKKIAVTTAAVAGLAGGAALISDEGLNGLNSYIKSSVTGRVTKAQVGAQEATNLSTIQTAGIFGEGKSVPVTTSLSRSDIQALIRHNVEDYVAFANSESLDPENIAPDLSDAGKQRIIASFEKAADSALSKTGEKTKILGSLRETSPNDVKIDRGNIDLFTENFRESLGKEVKDLKEKGLQDISAQHLETSMLDGDKSGSVMKKLHGQLGM